MMSARIIDFPKAAVAEPVIVTSADVFRSILPAVPESEITRLLYELWIRGFKVVPIEEDDDD